MPKTLDKQLAAVEIDSLTKTFGRRRAVSDVTLTVPRGQVFGLVGPNGAGKTTLLRMLVGLLRPTAGTVRLFGHDAYRDFENAIASVGAIIESPNMYKYFTGRQNLVQYARMRSDVSAERIDEVVRFVELTDRIDERITRYSLGMRQRLGIAQALLHNPSLLILDEPTNGLDPAGMSDLRRMIRQLADDNRTSVIVSSHLLHDIEAICDSIAVMQSGRVVATGSMSDFIDAAHPAYRVTVGDVESAAAIATREGWHIAASDYTTRSLVVESNRDTADLNLSLIQAGVRVSTIEPVRRSLEEAFLSITHNPPASHS